MLYRQRELGGVGGSCLDLVELVIGLMIMWYINKIFKHFLTHFLPHKLPFEPSRHVELDLIVRKIEIFYDFNQNSSLWRAIEKNITMKEKIEFARKWKLEHTELS